MHVVIFEFEPKRKKRCEYLDIATTLSEELKKIDGFISVERFESLGSKGKLLSLSFWENETAIKAWRNHIKHQHAQELGHNKLFNDYRIRIAEIYRDYSKSNRSAAPSDSVIK